MLEFGGVFEEREWRWDDEIMVEWIMFANKPDDGGSTDEVYGWCYWNRFGVWFGGESGLFVVVSTDVLKGK